MRGPSLGGTASASLAWSSNSGFRAMVWPAAVNDRSCTGHPFVRAATRGPSRAGERATGACYASQAVELLPALYPEIVVRDARLEDCWEVADTHCSSFFPGYKFPLDLVLRIDRYIALLSGFSVPPGCMRTCLVAVNSNSVNNSYSIECGDARDADFKKYSLGRGSVAGILTVDTVADYLPRRGALKQRRPWIRSGRRPSLKPRRDQAKESNPKTSKKPWVCRRNLRSMLRRRRPCPRTRPTRTSLSCTDCTSRPLLEM